MDNLDTELDRLFAVAPGASPMTLADAAGRTRALVLEVAQPTGWDALAPLWQGVQSELDLPATAIAVSGTDGLQLWFSLESPVDPTQGHAFLDALRARFLADVPPGRVRLLPDPAQPGRTPAMVPALQVNCTDWSAWVAPELAVMFTDTPWLDIEPVDDGQAALLRPLRSIKPAEFDAALARLREPASRADADAPASPPTLPGERAPAPLSAAVTSASPAASREDDPRRFLLRVMNDERIDMALRIEAAKALLP
ncbi:MAG: hypothetical protein JF586_12385 [Burkholderiales bacterium]|nr:hypothetical protein [Burkholderiales bacterium]